MKILIAGGTGFVGRNLIQHLLKQHKLSVVGRNKAKIAALFGDQLESYDWQSFTKLNANDFDVVINLCGKNIAESRWSERVKQEIIDSRTKTTKHLLAWAEPAKQSIRFYCANAIGIYGVQTDDDTQAFDEDSIIQALSDDSDFLTTVGVLWQQAALASDINTTVMRFGVVLKKGEGMLNKLTPSFTLGLGSTIGQGLQSLSWIHIDDLVRAIDFLISEPRPCREINLTSPLPISQKEFARALATSLHRPLLLKIPKFVIRLLLGEMGEYLINRGQRVLPKRITELGFEFRYPTIEQALAKEFNHKG